MTKIESGLAVPVCVAAMLCSVYEPHVKV